MHPATVTTSSAAAINSSHLAIVRNGEDRRCRVIGNNVTHQAPYRVRLLTNRSRGTVVGLSSKTVFYSAEQSLAGEISVTITRYYKKLLSWYKCSYPSACAVAD
jgi:hypothetical protein